MDRRTFMGSVVAGVAAAKLSGVPLSALPLQSSPGDTKASGRWIENGLIDAGGNHEPLIFMVRRGGQPTNYREVYEKAQSEELISLLASQGVDVFHTHFYKGFGMAAEMPGMRDTIRTAAIAHKNGMKLDAYIQWDTMMYETFFAEEPRAQQWVQRDAAGQPILLRYGYQQSFRYRPCFSNQEYIDYLKKIVRFAVVEVKADFIHFDNFDLNAEPDSCHCDACKSGFRKRLRTKYTEDQLRDRLGFVNVDYVNPPLWNRNNPPERLNLIYEPGLQEWIDYRCQTMADALGQIATEIRSLNPNVAIEINPDGIAGRNSPWYSGVDLARLLKHSDVFWAETRTEPAYLSDKTLVSTVRTYKAGRAFRNIAFTYTSDSEAAIGENLAFNQTIGFPGESPLTPEMVRYIAFYRKHRERYVGSNDVASVAVLRSYPSITYNHSGSGLSALLVEQALIQARVPFHIYFDEHLESLSPSRCKVLVLPNSECLSDKQLASLRRFVDAGGALVVTEQTGLYDEWRRIRVTPGLRGLIDQQVLGAAYEANVHGLWQAFDMSLHTNGTPTAASAGDTLHKELGRGRVAYIPGVEFDGPLPAPEPYFMLGTKFWKRPKNWEQIVQAVSWAARGDLQLEIDAPDFVIANLVEQPEKQRRLLHLVNCDFKNTPSVRDVRVRCAGSAGKAATSVSLYSPDSDAAQNVPFQKKDGMAVFTVPTLRAYCMVEVH